MASAPASKVSAPPATDAGVSAAPERRPTGSGFLGRHRRAVLTVLGAVLVAGFVYYVVPQIAGLEPTLRRLRGGDPWWLALGVLLEAISYLGEMALFRGVFSRPGRPMGWRTSAQITLAGGAATKILATAGAGGIALSVWALRACGLPAAEVASGMVCYEILTYAVYMAALAIGGFGLWFGVFSGPAPAGLTLVPALFGTAVITIVASMLYVDEPVERYLVRRADAATGDSSGGCGEPRRFRVPSNPDCAQRWRWSAGATCRCSAPSSPGASISAHSGCRLKPSDTPRPARSW